MAEDQPILKWEVTMETDYASWVSTTDIGTLRRCFLSVKSSRAGVLFAASRDLLVHVATLLDDTTPGNAARRQRRLLQLIESGQIQRGADADSARIGLGVDLEAIPNERFCHVIYLPPLFLVYDPGLRMLPSRQIDPAPCLHNGC
jgi:hypothetical protein